MGFTCKFKKSVYGIFFVGFKNEESTYVKIKQKYMYGVMKCLKMQ